MNELLTLYWPTIVAAALCAGALSFVGAILVTRQAGVQALAVSQSAGLGVSLGLLFTQIYFADGHIEHTLLPLIFGLSSSALGFAGTENLARKSQSPTVIYLGSFVLFWGMSQLLMGFFPVVESHSSAIYFGDLVTLTRGESFFFMALALTCGGALALTWKKQAELAFTASILEEPFNFRRPADLLFYFIALLLLCFSVQLLGLLFTLATLFLPTAVYGFSSRPGAGRHLLRASLSAGIATALGFILSLSDGRFLTTPLIAILLAFFPLLHLLAERAFFKCK